MLEKFNQIRIELITAAADDESEIRIDASKGFSSKTKKYASMLSMIDFVTKYLQNSGRYFSEFQDSLDSSLDECEKDKLNPES